ncbi:MAG: hypothetical protein SFU25_10915 [Candidatus Caenarcaniphilales bacterium]|nr:hypothetical protein [Candidatus Caenarcaniphilales bacterium]
MSATPPTVSTNRNTVASGTCNGAPPLQINTNVFQPTKATLFPGSIGENTNIGSKHFLLLQKPAVQVGFPSPYPSSSPIPNGKAFKITFQGRSETFWANKEDTIPALEAMYTNDSSENTFYVAKRQNPAGEKYFYIRKAFYCRGGELALDKESPLNAQGEASARASEGIASLSTQAADSFARDEAV